MYLIIKIEIHRLIEKGESYSLETEGEYSSTSTCSLAR